MWRRGEYVERTFAHVYDTGGLRRVYLRGHPNILKRLIVHAGAFNLGLLMRHVFGRGTPRGLQSRRQPWDLLWLTLYFLLAVLRPTLTRRLARGGISSFVLAHHNGPPPRAAKPTPGPVCRPSELVLRAESSKVYESQWFLALGSLVRSSATCRLSQRALRLCRRSLPPPQIATWCFRKNATSILQSWTKPQKMELYRRTVRKCIRLHGARSVSRVRLNAWP
jgi:hypothetical protein